MKRFKTKDAIVLATALGPVTGLIDDISVIITIDDNKVHASIAKKDSYPTWDEIKDFRYKYLPDHLTFGLLFPPKREYVNVHPNCFHLWEI